MLSLKQIIIGLLIGSAIFLSLYLYSISKKIEVKNNITTINRPDAFMENVIATTINKEGLPSLVLETPKMTHYTDHDRTDIQAPHVTLYNHSPQPWVIDSRSAETIQGLDRIIFLDNVVIHHVEDISQPETFIRTHSLMLTPPTNEATTQDPVALTQPDLTISGIGLSANLDTGIIHLLSSARGEYAPY